MLTSDLDIYLKLNVRPLRSLNLSFFISHLYVKRTYGHVLLDR